MDTFLKSYLETALWSSTDGEESTPLDDNYSIDDISMEAIEDATNDIYEFKRICGALLDGLDDSDLGHNFWLTRNGHGAGFWDGDYEEKLGEKLTEISEDFGECWLYVGDDKKLYFM